MSRPFSLLPLLPHVPSFSRSLPSLQLKLTRHLLFVSLSPVDDMEEDEGEEEEEEEDEEVSSEAEDATKEEEKVVEPPVSSEKAPVAEKVLEEKSILEFSVDDMADALSKMSVVKDSA